jgi:nitrogen fixation protein FixH
MKRGAWWPVAIGGALAVTVAANGFLLRAASAPGATATEPESYHRAVAWDSVAAEAARAAELGWSANAHLARQGRRLRLEVALTDRSGTAIHDAAVSVVAIHNLEPAHRARVTLAPVPGGYAALLPSTRAGLWELRISAVRRGDHWVNTLRRDAPADRP